MDSAGLISTIRSAQSLEVISVQNVGRVGAKWSIHGGAFLSKWGRSYATPVGTRRVCVEAVETSSRPKGAAARKPFVEPQWLFSSNNGANLRGTSDPSQESTSETVWSSSQSKDQSQSVALYYIVISTSKDEKSSLSEPNAGILLTMIGEDGNAAMHKISGTEESGGDAGKSSLRFQRGAVDSMIVAGPDLGRLAALWIAPEAGTWRLEKVSVTILPWSEKLVSEDGLWSRDVISFVNSDLLEEMASMGNWRGVFHLFPSNEALLGSDAWLAAAELKPSLIQEISDMVDLQEKLLQLSPKRPQSPHGVAKLREESMKEYENLKLTLLGFSFLLVVGGTASLAALGQGNLAEGYAVGGVGGFLYLLLLQRAVDQLPSSNSADIGDTHVDLPISAPRQPVVVKEGENEPEASSQEQGKSPKNVESFSPRGSLSGTSNIGLRGRIILVAGVALVLGRLAGGGAVSTISPPQLLAGVVGFLTSKVAVVLAALKPSSSRGDK
ncbi:unnamed protein product [Calypogeia fissa]